MAKKNWIYIKRGLSEDPKHRAQMGECVWLYMHIIDRADWETGIAYDWKDGQEAADMGMSVDTLRRQRQKLEEFDYIRCSQKQRGQEVKIMEWRNPRDYGSEVKNPRLTSHLCGLTDDSGLSQGLNHVPEQVKTHTSNSKSLSSVHSNMPLDWYIQHGLPIPPELTEKNKIEADAVNEFESALGFGQLPWDSVIGWQTFKKWVVKIYQSDPQTFRKYAEWRSGKGKYEAMSNKQIRQSPAQFIDTGYPAFMAHNTMNAKPDWQDRSHAL